MTDFLNRFVFGILILMMTVSATVSVSFFSAQSLTEISLSDELEKKSERDVEDSEEEKEEKEEKEEEREEFEQSEYQLVVYNCDSSSLNAYDKTCNSIQPHIDIDTPPPIV